MYDVVIMATKKNISVLKISLSYINKNLDADNIYIVTNRRHFDALSELNVNVIDEETIFDGMTFDRIMDLIEERCGERKRAGWYLQQFVKMAWSLKTEKEYYVVFDADTIPLKHIEYIDSSGKYLLTQKKEYHKPYFDTINTLFGGEFGKAAEGSFIAENMIFDTEIMRSLIKKIESVENVKGDFFYEKIINSINIEELVNSGFSEFETYGNYVYSFYPEKVCLRKLRTLREAMQIIGSFPTAEQLEWASMEYEVISIEAPNYKNTFLTKLTKNSIFRRFFKMSILARLRTGVRTVYRKIIKKQDMVFD